MTRRIAFVTAAYVLLTVVMTWPYVNYGAFASATYGGDQRLIVWTLAWDNHAVLDWQPLFQSNLFFPAQHSLQYNEHLFGVSLFTLPWAAAGASPILAHHATWWLAFPLNGLAAWLLIRRSVASDVAAFVGSLVFVFSFYVMSHAHGHLHLIWLWPIPLSLLLFERWFDAPTLPRLARWTAVALIGLLTSWYVAVFLVVAHALFAVLLVAPRAGGPWRTRLRQFGLATIVMAAVVYPFARHYGQISSSRVEVVDNSADAASYVMPPANSLVGRELLTRGDTRPREIWGETTLFTGWVALSAAIAGGLLFAARRPRNARAWLLPLLAVTAGLLSFGPSIPGIGITPFAPFNALAALPGLDGIRAPARFAALMNLGLAGLIATAVAGVMTRFGRAGLVATLALVPLMLAEWFVVEFPAGKPAPHAIPAIYQTAEVRGARSLVSLPEYTDSVEWVRGANYLLYSTVHWRPIVNGFGRTMPPGHGGVVATVRAFPESIPRMRALGIQYVVVHADRFPDAAASLLAAAEGRADCRLVRRIDTDYLFELLPE
ncbi:MAG: hypothetical protein AB7P99_08630 [Vicinamibacterales bacterium]